MPQLIDLPDVGPVEFPDDATEDEILSFARKLTNVTPSLQPVMQQSQLRQSQPEFVMPEQPRLPDLTREDVGQALQQMAGPIPMPEPTQAFRQRNPMLGSALQRVAQTAGTVLSPAGLATLPLFDIPIVGPALGLGLGAKVFGSGAGEVAAGGPENVGGGLVDSLLGSLMLAGGGAGAREPISEVTPAGRLAAELRRSEIILGSEALPLPNRQLGFRLTPNAAEVSPEVRRLVDQAIFETSPQGQLALPGQTRALPQLQAETYGTGLQSGESAVLQRPGGGAAQGGKVSFAAEAPTLTRNVPTARPEAPLSEQARLMAQQFIPAAEKTTIPQGGPSAPRIRGNQGGVSTEGLPAQAGQEARGQDLQREQTGTEEPSAPGIRQEAPQGGIRIPEPKGPPSEAGGFMLPGPELIRTLSGFKESAKVAGQQLWNRARNILHPEEFEWYNREGLRTFLASPRSPKETAEWMREHRVRVEAKVFGGETVDLERREASELQHKLETLGYTMGSSGSVMIQGSRTAPNQLTEMSFERAAKLEHLPSEHRSIMKRLGELHDVRDFRQESPYFNPDQYRGVSMRDAPQKVVMVRVPHEYRGGYVVKAKNGDTFGQFADHEEAVAQKERLEEEYPHLAPFKTAYGEAEKIFPLHRGQHFGSEDVNILGWSRGFDADVGRRKALVLDEVQSDWGQGRREVEAAKEALERRGGRQDPNAERQYPPHPLLKDWPRLTLKATIDQAIKEGKEGIVLPDAETAMMTEGHDMNLRANGEPVQAGGMRLNYDTILPKIMSELTGVKGEKVDLGEHQRAFETPSDMFLGNVAGRNTVPRSKLIFRNPDGTPKTHATGTYYDLSKVKESGTDYSPFGSGKPSAKGGLGVKAAQERAAQRGGETGAFTLEPLKKVVEWLTPKKPEAITDAEIRTGTGGPVIMFRDYATEQKIATSPQGIGRIPGLAQIFDPRATAKDPVMRAILTGQSMRAKAANIATLYLEATKLQPRAFMAGSDGKVALAGNQRGYISDVIEAELRQPGSQPITADQRAFINSWRALRGGLVDYARSEGVRSFVDDNGNIIPLSRDYFPRPAYGKEGFEDTRNVAHTSVGGRQFFMQQRYYPTEAAGATAQHAIKYEPDGYVRVAKYMESVYKAIADERLANDPALQGRPASMGRARFLEEGGSFVPLARGRIFPKEVADKLNKYYGAQPHALTRHIADVNDFLKAFKFTMDVSAPFNQGLLMMARHPLKWANATLRSYAALLDTNQLARYLEPRMADAIEFVNHGGSLGSLEDFLIGAKKGKLSQRVPLASTIIRRSAESMNTFLSVGKLEMFRALKDTVPANQLPKLVESVENTILSGRMESIGLTPARATAERILFNAPSYLRAAANIIASTMEGKISGSVAREHLGVFAGAVTLTMLGLYHKAGLSSDEIKERLWPGNSKFLRYPLKLSNGDVIEIGPGNVITQVIRLIGNLTDVTTGDKPFSPGVEGNPLIRWASYRKSPVVELATEIYTGKDYLGREIGATEATLRSAVPISAEQLVGKEKPGTKRVEAGLQVLGLSSFPENYSTTKTRLENEAGQLLFKKDYAQLSTRERFQVTKQIEPMLKEKKEETEPPSASYVQKQQDLQRGRLHDALPKDQQEWLASQKLKVPGYRLETTLAGTEVEFTKAEKQRYEELVSLQYAKMIDRLSKNANFARAMPTQKENLFSQMMGQARNVAKAQLLRELQQQRKADQGKTEQPR